LLHDDVIDNDSIRRRKKTPNFIWGNHFSILTGDYLLSRCFEMMVEDGNLEILKLLSSTSAKIAQGEILQLQHKGEIDMLEETYLKIISFKTAVLFSAATKVGAILSESNNKDKEALEFYGNNLGLTFQIADDALDYNSEINIFGKETGNDFFEGKITLPIILLFQQSNDSEKKELINFFKKNIRTKEEFSIVLKLISKYKIVSQCYEKAQHFINLAKSSLTIFKESKEKKILENLTSFSLERSF
jgi:octaprenyl-diphosphate synthase